MGLGETTVLLRIELGLVVCKAHILSTVLSLWSQSPLLKLLGHKLLEFYVQISNMVLKDPRTWGYAHFPRLQVGEGLLRNLFEHHVTASKTPDLEVITGQKPSEASSPASIYGLAQAS